MIVFCLQYTRSVHCDDDHAEKSKTENCFGKIKKLPSCKRTEAVFRGTTFFYKQLTLLTFSSTSEN